jgi:hypothetical protein
MFVTSRERQRPDVRLASSGRWRSRLVAKTVFFTTNVEIGTMGKPIFLTGYPNAAGPSERNLVMKRLLVALALVSLLFAARSVCADPPKAPSTPYVVIPAPTAAQAQPVPVQPSQGQILPAPTLLAPSPDPVMSGTPVTVISDHAPFVPVHCDCAAHGRVRFWQRDKPIEPCQCLSCTSPRCLWRFQFGSCQAFFGEGAYNPNNFIAPTHP